MAMRNPEQTIGNLIDSQSVSFIGSIDAEGFPNMKAMLPPRKREGIKEFWFTSNTSSMRASQYCKNPNACIYFFDKRFFRGVMLKGKIEVLTDNEIRAEIWREGDNQHYKSVTAEDYCVLHFTAHSGRFYSNFNSEDFNI
jgi:general stress protein 26